MNTVFMEDMTWPEVMDAREGGYDTVVIPAASIEQHGHHLPLNTDEVLGRNAAGELARRIGRALVAPVIRPGLSGHHMAMAGTVTLRPETFALLVEDYVDSYRRHGFKTVILMASHGGNMAALDEISARLDAALPDMRIISAHEVPGLKELEEITLERGLSIGANGGHADDRETSEMMCLASFAVRADRLTPGFSERLTPELRARFFSEGVRALTEVGAVGDPSGANAGRGRWYIRHTAERLAADVNAKLKEKEG